MSYIKQYLLTAIILPLLLLSGCGESDYLLQCAKGQLAIMSRTKPIEDIIAQGTESKHVRDQLSKVLKMRAFAVNSLHLPDSGSYREYADLERPYVVWNLVAAPELSLALKQWCFPIAGCVSYRGYFDEVSARTVAESLAAQGFDVDVYGVQAYSTLNWFDDPILNTFLTNDDARLAALLFHEMSHQITYVQNDTAFNESFAKTVEMEGMRRWLLKTGSSDLWRQYLQHEDHSIAFNHLLSAIRTELSLVYASALDNEQKKRAKQKVLSQSLAEYELLKKSWNGYDGFDLWMSDGLNNARLSSMATYYELVPAFQVLLGQVDFDLNKFYEKVKILGSLPKNDRLAKLKSLSSGLHASLN